MSRFDGPAFEKMVEIACDKYARWGHDIDPDEKIPRYLVEPYAASVEDARQFMPLALVAALSATETREDPRTNAEGPSPSGPQDLQSTSWLWLRWAEEAGVMAPRGVVCEEGFFEWPDAPSTTAVERKVEWLDSTDCGPHWLAYRIVPPTPRES